MDNKTTHAYERPIDNDSVQKRMEEQLQFESHLSRSVPRRFDVEENERPGLSKKATKAARTLGVVTVLAGTAAGLGSLRDDPAPPRAPEMHQPDYMKEGTQPKVPKNVNFIPARKYKA